MNAEIIEVGPGWSLKNLSCDPPKIIIRVYESSGESEPIIRGVNALTSSQNYTELDLNELCTYPILHEGEDYKYLVYIFKDVTCGFSSAEIEIDVNTDLPTYVYLSSFDFDPGPIAE